ncbi:hypothetical protein RZS08_30935, partial [Arthrospira platensis SPKY1]|nr:hypothetical protein [Arthrospira platensis SPKY1]
MVFHEELTSSLIQWNRMEAIGGSPLSRQSFDELNERIGNPFEYREGITDAQFELMRELYI